VDKLAIEAFLHEKKVLCSASLCMLNNENQIILLSFLKTGKDTILIYFQLHITSKNNFLAILIIFDVISFLYKDHFVMEENFTLL